jgi:hypothetical protein
VPGSGDFAWILKRVQDDGEILGLDVADQGRR